MLKFAIIATSLPALAAGASAVCCQLGVCCGTSWCFLC
jgi:hypothetical protein